MIVADAHADTVYELAMAAGERPPSAEALSALLSGSLPDGRPLHITLPRMRTNRQVLQVCSIFTPARHSGAEATAFADRLLDWFDAILRAWPDDLYRVQSRDDLPATNARAIGWMPWLEGASPLAGDLSRLEHFFRRGVRGIGLTHNHRNEAADGCGVSEPRRGLSDFGKKLIPAMEALGVAVDCAHLPEPAFSQVMERVARPPCISHTGCRPLAPIARNADDAMLRAIAARDGFVGIDFYPGHVLENAFADGRRPATAADVAAHVAHAVKVCGPGRVGLGSDWDGFQDTCTDLRHAGDLPNLVGALRAAGLPEGEMAGILGGNLLAYLARVLP